METGVSSELDKSLLFIFVTIIFYFIFVLFFILSFVGNIDCPMELDSE